MKCSMTRLRQILKDELEKYEGAPITLPYDEKFLNYLLFKGDSKYKKFSEQLTEVLTKINYSNVNFDGFAAKEFDFSPYVGIKINPQTVYFKEMNNAICKGVQFIGPFDNVKVQGTNFKGSKGAKINPQTIYNRNLINAVCADVEFIGSFESANTEGADFTGSNYEAPVLEENEFREKIKTLIYANYIE